MSYNCKELTANCIRSILREDASINICVVDNASADGTCEMLATEFPEVQVIANKENLGYSKAINMGALNSDEDYLILSNADVVFHENSIQKLLNTLKYLPKVGAVAPKQLFVNGSIQQSSGFIPGIKASIINYLMIYPILNRLSSIFKLTFDYLDGAVLCVSSKLFEVLGGFDEQFFFYSEDADFSKRIRNMGYSVLVNYDATVTHYRGASTNIAGINHSALEQFVNAKVFLSNKYNSAKITRIYICSEIFITNVMKIAFTILSVLSHKSNYQYKSKYYKLLNQVWRKIKI